MLNQNKFGENQLIREQRFKIKANCQVAPLKIKTNVHTLLGKNLLILTKKTAEMHEKKFQQSQNLGIPLEKTVHAVRYITRYVCGHCRLYITMIECPLLILSNPWLKNCIRGQGFNR